jgi:ABC-type nitrate/sulfonate/bicarbonate transport system substrate-binding protein
MRDLPTYDLRIMFRAGHSYVWELAEKAGILANLGLGIKTLESAEYSGKADDALFKGEIDFIVGNHISPYLHMANGLPVVCIASPGNFVRDRIISREPVESLEDFKGKGLRVADSYFVDQWGGLNHPRGNHMLDVARAGFEPGEAEWVEVGHLYTPELEPAVVEAVTTGKADVGFIMGGNLDELRKEGLHVTTLPTLPMVNGSTITTSYQALAKHEQLAERLVKAMVLTIHYARVHPEESQRLLSTRMGKPYEEWGGRVQSVARYRLKAYPDPEGVANAHELSTTRHEEAKTIQPMALWDMHYLRELDMTGFIDELLQEEPEEIRRQGVDLP